MISTVSPTRLDRFTVAHRAGVVSRFGMGLLLLVFSAVSANQVLAQDAGSGEFTEDLPEELVGVDIVEHLDETLPLDLVFTDEDGERIKLGDIIDGERPTILQIGYFKCPMLCNLVLNEAMDGLAGVDDLSAGTDFDLVAVSINPNEGHELARVKKEGYLLEYARPGASRGFHFLTGSAENTKALADAVGFQYRLQDDGEYAHAAALFVITPDGRISRYLYGVRYEPATLRFALMEGAEGRIGSTLERFILWCHVYDPDSGSYHLLAFRVMQLGGLATVFVMVVGVGLLWLRDRRRTSGIESRDQIASPGAGR
ncbi:MAG: SCO family protein [Phycisphaeraceae bacterium]|nr:SCO family protein [Phycisphaeraceae bacterium]MCP4797625.1 SCO family protein [Phycisphaeraceae bacterium]